MAIELSVSGYSLPKKKKTRRIWSSSYFVVIGASANARKLRGKQKGIGNTIEPAHA
jgi:hypothetical protein